MKVFLTIVLLSFFGSMSYAQWQTLTFAPDSVRNCTYTEMVASVSGWRGYLSSSGASDCITGELLSDNQTIHIENSLASTSRNLSVSLSSIVLDTLVGEVQLPWSSAEYGVLKIRVVSASTGEPISISGSSSFTFGPVLQSSGSYYIQPRIYVPVGEERADECDFRIIKGGQSIYLNRFYFPIDDAIDLSAGFDFRVEYDVEVVDANRYTSLLAPTDAFDGQSYQIHLESNHTQIAADYPAEFTVGLEENTPTAQHIRVIKQGGSLELATHRFLVQEAEQTNEPHIVSYEFNDVTMCLNGEWLLPVGSSFSLHDGNIGFASQFSCIAVSPSTQLVFRGVVPQQIASDGIGMLLLLDSSEVVLQPHTKVDFGGIVATHFLDDDDLLFPVARISLKSGATFTVNALAKVYADRPELQRPKSIKVTVADGATFDMSTANSDVRAMFDVEYQSTQVSSTTSFNVYPNPASNRTTISWPQQEAPAAIVKLYDITGQLIFSDANLSGLDEYEVPFQQPGTFTLHITDHAGNITYHRVISQ